MRIQHNVTALNSHRNLTNNNNALTKNLEKLSSGYRINRAGDDAAGLAISEKMRAQITGLQTAQKNAEDGVSLVQTAEGALTEVHSMLNRMVELATQSANGTYSTSNRAEMQKEIDALTKEIDRISETSNFNGTKLFSGGTAKIDVKVSGAKVTAGTADANGNMQYDFSKLQKNDTVQINGKTYTMVDGAAGGKDDAAAGTFTTIDKLKDMAAANGVNFGGAANTAWTATVDGVSIALHVGESSADANAIAVQIKEMTSDTLGVKGLDITTADTAKAAIDTVNDAIDSVSSIRSDLGALQNRLEHTINNLGVQTENITAAESRIRDVDMAKEMMNYTKNNILVQASQAMLAQANQVPQGVLQLLQ